MIKVLIISNDDFETHSLLYAVNNLEISFDDIDVVDSCKDAILKMSEIVPDILIMNVDTSDTQWLEVMGVARKVNRFVQAVIITSYDQFDHISDMNVPNVRDYLLKPLSISAVSEVVTKFVKETMGYKEHVILKTNMQEKYESAIEALENVKNMYDSFVSQDLNSKQQSALYKVDSYIKRNYDKNITLQKLSGELNENRNMITRLFKGANGNTFNEILLNVRVMKACDLIMNSDMMIGEVANAVGYSDACYFSKRFKSIMGISPTDYRKAAVSRSEEYVR